MQLERHFIYNTRGGGEAGPLNTSDDSRKFWTDALGNERDSTGVAIGIFGDPDPDRDIISCARRSEPEAVGVILSPQPQKITTADLPDHSEREEEFADMRPAGDILQSPPEYQSLAGILQSAINQASAGKGAERHTDRPTPFLEQPIMEIARMLGSIDGHAYQIMKKAQESARMTKRGNYDGAVKDLLGAVNYCAAAILLIRELQDQDRPLSDDAE